MSGRHGFYGRMAREASLSGAASHAQAGLFRALLAETDAALRQAWAAGRLPSGVIPDDLIERTRAALAGETQAKPMTTTEAIADAVRRLEGHSL